MDIYHRFRKKTGTKIATKEVEEVNRFDRNRVEKLGAKKLGDEMFFGKMCEVWERESPFMISKTWSYKGIPLKMETTGNPIVGRYVSEAVRFEENVSVPANKFVVPEGIAITEIEISAEDKKVGKEVIEEMLKGFPQIQGKGEFQTRTFQVKDQKLAL